MVICLERGADLHMAQLMPLPLTVSCFSKILWPGSKKYLTIYLKLIVRSTYDSDLQRAKISEEYRKVIYERSCK